jgi:hypothetical protein
VDFRCLQRDISKLAWPDPILPAFSGHHRSMGDMFHEIEQETVTLTFFERLWAYFSMILQRCLDTLDRFFNLGPEFQYCIEAISNAFQAVKPLQGCET